jgi:hypothetical protein
MMILPIACARQYITSSIQLVQAKEKVFSKKPKHLLVEKRTLEFPDMGTSKSRGKMASILLKKVVVNRKTDKIEKRP